MNGLMSKPSASPAAPRPRAKKSSPKPLHSENWFKTAFNNSPAMHSILRLSDNRFVEVNETFTRALGLSREAVIGRTPQELNFWLCPEQRQEYSGTLQECGCVKGYEVAVRSADGRILTVLLSSEYVEIDGEPHILSAAVDITARQQAEEKLRVSNEQLRQSEERFSKIFHASPAMAALTRFSDGKIVAANEAFVCGTGWTESEVVGRTALDLKLYARPEDRDEFLRLMQRQGCIRNREHLLRMKDGELRTILTSAELLDLNGETHLLIVGLDISARKQIEAELQKALGKERELSQLKSDFVSLVSHEFRTPLEIIMSSGDNLSRYHDRLSPEKRQQLLKSIHKSVRRMSDMMEEVLFLGRMDSGRIDFNPVPFDLETLCQRVRDEMKSAMNNRCPIELSLPANLRAQARGDESVLRHILTNLLSNACKYSPEGAVVELRVTAAGPSARFEIVDRGVGIPKADQERLFEAFHRGENVRHIHGTGLGLVIVQRCVTLHGGLVSFESAEGKGTTFRVTLPLFEGKKGGSPS